MVNFFHQVKTKKTRKKKKPTQKQRKNLEKKKKCQRNLRIKDSQFAERSYVPARFK